MILSTTIAIYQTRSTGWSSADDDTFAICIVHFESVVFWIEAIDNDDIGYFDTSEVAT